MTLTYQRKTELAEVKVKEFHANVMRRFNAIRKQGGFIGDIERPAPERLNAYWASITPPMGTLADIALITDPDAERKIRSGEDPVGPQSPAWINYLRIPGLFTEHARDFVALNEADVKRRGNNEKVPPNPGESTPVPESGGPPGYG